MDGRQSEMRVDEAGSSGVVVREIESAAPSVFHASSNLMVTGGHFTAQQGSTAHIIVNVNSTSQDNQSSSTATESPTAAVGDARHRHSGSESPQYSVLPPQCIYENHLSTKGRGYPLWSPQTNMRLPIEYRKDGVRIGDVGILNRFGGFDFLFNICTSADDPINPRQLPEGFEALHPPLDPTSDISANKSYVSGRYLASSSIVKSITDPSGLVFESSASDGAILTMPEGAYNEDLANTARFRNYIAQHAVSWYKYANGPRGREVQNGDLHLVIGSDKSSSWGMAAFSNVTQQPNLRLQFKALEEHDSNRLSSGLCYVWEHTGSAEVKVGPDYEENADLRAAYDEQLRNQCLFLRTMDVTLSNKAWQKLNFGLGVSVGAGRKRKSDAKYGRRTRKRSENDAEFSGQGGSSRWASGNKYAGMGDSGTLGPDVNMEKGLSDVLGGPCLECNTTSSSVWCRGPRGPKTLCNACGIAFASTLSARQRGKLPDIQEYHDHEAQSLAPFSSEAMSLDGQSTSSESGFGDADHGMASTDEDSSDGSDSEFGLPSVSIKLSLPPLPTQRPLGRLNDILLEINPSATVAISSHRALQDLPNGWSNWSSLSIIEYLRLSDMLIIHDDLIAIKPREYDHESLALERETMHEISQIDFTELASCTNYVFNCEETTNRQSVVNRLIMTQFGGGMHDLEIETDGDPILSSPTPLPAMEGHPWRPFCIEEIVNFKEAPVTNVDLAKDVEFYQNELATCLSQTSWAWSEKGASFQRVGRALLKRFRRFQIREDLDDSLSYLQEAEKALPTNNYRYLEVLLDLCIAYHHRFQLIRLDEDRILLAETLSKQLNIDVDLALAQVKHTFDKMFEESRSLQSADVEWLNQLQPGLLDWTCILCRKANVLCHEADEGKPCQRCELVGGICKFSSQDSEDLPRAPRPPPIKQRPKEPERPVKLVPRPAPHYPGMYDPPLQWNPAPFPGYNPPPIYNPPFVPGPPPVWYPLLPPGAPHPGILPPVYYPPLQPPPPPPLPPLMVPGPAGTRTATPSIPPVARPPGLPPLGTNAAPTPPGISPLKPLPPPKPLLPPKPLVAPLVKPIVSTGSEMTVKPGLPLALKPAVSMPAEKKPETGALTALINATKASDAPQVQVQTQVHVQAITTGALAGSASSSSCLPPPP